MYMMDMPSCFGLPTVTEKLRISRAGSNYDSWKEEMLEILKHEELMAFIDGKSNPPPKLIQAGDAAHFPAVNQEYSRWKKMDSWLKEFILSCVELDAGSIVLVNSVILTAREVWTTLERIDRFIWRLQLPDSEADNSYYRDCLAIRKAVNQNNMKEVENLYGRYKGGREEEYNRLKLMTVYLATGTGRSLFNVVEQLNNDNPPFLPDYALKWKSEEGQTLLTIAAAVGNLSAAEILVNKCPVLLYTENEYGELPVHVAAIHSHRKTLEYLISQSTEHRRIDHIHSPFTRRSHGLDLLLAVIDAGYFDIGVNLVGEHPHLATEKNTEGTTPLKLLARKKASFDPALRFRVLGPFVFLMSKGMKNKHTIMPQDALKLVRMLCKKMEENASQSQVELWRSAMFAAVEEGNYEVTKEILETFPDVVWSVSPDSGENMFHVAVKQRSIEIFNLLSRMRDYRSLILHKPDNHGNNVLHLAGKLAPADRLNVISGSALQMQYEIQWYKALETLVPDYCKERLNNDGYSPMDLFRNEHQKLKQEGEKWMRDTAQSCSIAAALIATVMFTAAIQVPGGSNPGESYSGGRNSTSGFPVFASDAAFTVFAVADAISLFTSTTSVLTFLSILTSRYREEDFFSGLPLRLIIGLLTLFLAISFLMVSFATTVFIVLGGMKMWVIAPVTIMAFVPIVTFVCMHFRVLVDWISSTCCLGMLVGKRRRRRFLVFC